MASVLVFFSVPIVGLWTSSEVAAGNVGPAAALPAAGTAINGVMHLTTRCSLQRAGRESRSGSLVLFAAAARAA